ncbi:MAG: sigma factor-like helix-turn-helix DNA-binding protein, partial [Rivularia sp. (in: cyanobacteria)]
ILDNDLETTIRRAIDALPPKLRSPFNMHFEQYMSYLDIAQKLGISVDCVYKRISQARAILKPQINKYLSEEDSTFLHIPLPSTKKEKPTKTKNPNKGIQQDLPPKLLTQSETNSKALYNQEMQCLYCQSTHISKNGHRREKQNYLCHKCDRQFVDSYSPKGYSSEVRERCLNLHINGMGCRAIGREVGVSHNTVNNWVKNATS